MKIAVITTINHNVGDDFVRAGIEYLFERVIGPSDWRYIHKHLPLTVRPLYGKIYKSKAFDVLDKIRPGLALHVGNALDLILPLDSSTDKILSSDIVIQSGAPIYWLNELGNCSQNEWYRPLINKRWDRMKDKTPFFNIAGGTCQKYDSDGSEFLNAPAALSYIRELFDKATLTTLRDNLSAKILQYAGRSAVVLPCTSLFAGLRYRIIPGDSEFIVLNYMPGAGHYRYNDSFDPARWCSIFCNVARALKSKGRCIISCHTMKEVNEVKSLLPEFELFYSTRYEDYLRLYSSARFGFVNRIHAAFAMASFGKPSIVVGSDSRARMCELIGLQCFNMAETNEESLMNAIDTLGAISKHYESMIIKLIEDTGRQYLHLIEKSLKQIC